MMYYYVESGIPVAVNLEPKDSSQNGHSLLCIGHGEINPDLEELAIEKQYMPWRSFSYNVSKDKHECNQTENIRVNPLINAADFYSDFIIVDDNQFLYQCKDFSDLSRYPDMEVANIAVPLYKRMFLDAPNAYAVVESILFHQEFGISAWTDDWKDENNNNILKNDEPVVFRLFMTSAKRFKAFRIKHDNNRTYAQVYGDFPLPRFVWVCELYRLNDYLGRCDVKSVSYKRPFAEILIDATSSPNRRELSVLWMRYPRKIVFKEPLQPTTNFPKENQMDCKFPEDDFFDAFDENLKGYSWP